MTKDNLELANKLTKQIEYLKGIINIVEDAQYLSVPNRHVLIDTPLPICEASLLEVKRIILEDLRKSLKESEEKFAQI